MPINHGPLPCLLTGRSHFHSWGCEKLNNTHVRLTLVQAISGLTAREHSSHFEKHVHCTAFVLSYSSKCSSGHKCFDVGPLLRLLLFKIVIPSLKSTTGVSVSLLKKSIHHYSVISVGSIYRLTRVFAKDGLSRDHGLHSRDHLPSPNHSVPHSHGFDSD